MSAANPPAPGVPSGVPSRVPSRVPSGVPSGVPSALERGFGDPWDPGNPLGFAAVVAADERAEPLPGGEELLDAHRLNHEFVPAELGGRLTDLGEMAVRLRTVFRRDGALGLGYGVTSLMAAVNVWVAGDPGQRRRLAGLLLRGGRAAVCFHELDSGNDLAGQRFRVTGGEPARLRGAKEVINNAGRAEALVLFARTSPAAGSRSHSLLLLERADLRGVRELPRYGTVGMRGCHLGGLVFDGCAVPPGSLVGPPGGGMETALRAFQLTRAALPSMAVGTLDTQLRTTLRFALGRRLYRRRVADLPQVREVLAAAFADLLACDALATCACRAPHVLPEQAGVAAAAAKYLVPRLLAEAADSLARVLGARFYLREGEHAIFQKHLRDLPALGLGHAGPAACLSAIVPQLPALARGARESESAGDDRAAPAALFRFGEPPPPLRPGRLALTSRGADGLHAALLPGLAELTRTGSSGEEVPALVNRLRSARRDLLGRCGRLPPRERTPLAGDVGFGLAERYALLLAASACVNIWRYGRAGADPFLRDPAWAAAALHRIAGRLEGAPAVLPAPLRERLFAELVARHETPRSLDLADRPVAG
ncbi:acyl-CoA dehydrogenase [Actinomadura viridis]|uniref:Alkylation response protein AidB-like acyl-CoA dehydrogenase n=1 Tax=Actinomadura viridis TaxID=58110 RepID=A0A931DEH0_9ACTN|nr:acyl-CoA dehydrogenase [Actinomadura viridis]MBG6086847.1 alkylation response protein AidB-like acyl-CoA dehydrogenase [Actinomadura viridis]